MTWVETPIPTMDDLTEWPTLYDLGEILEPHGIGIRDVIPNGIRIDLNLYRRPVDPPLVLRVVTFVRDPAGERIYDAETGTFAKRHYRIPIAALPVLTPPV